MARIYYFMKATPIIRISADICAKPILSAPYSREKGPADRRQSWQASGMAITTEPSFLFMKDALEAHLGGSLPREDFLTSLKWEMAAADYLTVLHFLSEVKNYPEVDETLLRQVTNTYRHVERWNLPEEPELSGSLSEAIECTLPELICSLSHAGNQLARVRDMLVGVNVRLNLVSSYAVIDEVLQLVRDELYLLDGACEVICDETGLAPSFPDEAAEGHPSWASSEGAPLSPDHIISLANLGRWNDMNSAISYKDGLCQHSTPPQLVTERILARKEELFWEAESREMGLDLRSAMEQACPRCDSWPGMPCRTKAGKETSMHRARLATVS